MAPPNALFYAANPNKDIAFLALSESKNGSGLRIISSNLQHAKTVANFLGI
jgi:hypothetical protein